MKEIKDKLKEWGSICRISNIMEDPLTYSHSDILSFAKYYHESKLNNNEVSDLVSKSLPTKDEFVSKGWSIARSSQYSRRKSVQNKVDDIYYSGWMDCYDWMINNDL